MSAAILMLGMMGSCMSSAAMFYTCTDGTLSMSNLNANSCLSFLTSNCSAENATCKTTVRCRYVEVLHENTANAISLQDISVFTMSGAVIAGTVKSATGVTDATELSSFADDETGTATIGTTVDAADPKVTDSVIIDLGEDKDVHKVVLKNTTTAADQGNIAGARVRFLRPKYVDETADGEYVKITDTPLISKAASTYTYKHMADAAKRVWT